MTGGGALHYNYRLFARTGGGVMTLDKTVPESEKGAVLSCHQRHVYI